MTKKLAVLISGAGSNLQAIINAIHDHVLDAEIVAVISNRKHAYGLDRAQKAELPVWVHGMRPYRKLYDNRAEAREAYDADLADILCEFQPDYVVLAGWMHILSKAFLMNYPNQVINLHPALPGQFAGTRAIKRAFDAYQRGEIRQTGVMVHFVPDEKVDEGPVLASEVVPIRASDTLQTLEARMHATEHRLLVDTLRTLCN